MKSLHLVITLALLAGLVSMTAFAGVIDSRNALSGQGRAGLDRARLESDMPAGQIKSGSGFKYDMSRATAKVEAINAAALVKYPKVSASGLSGTYMIPGDFPDLVSAAAVINFVGLAGDATFELTSTSYLSGTVAFGPYAGNDTYTLTIQPSAGAAVTMNFLATSTNGKGFVFNGAKNITIQGDNGGSSLVLGMDNTLGFPSGDAFGSTIFITNVSSDIAVLNTHVKGNFDTPAWADQTEARSGVFIWVGADDADLNSNLTFDGDTFTGGSVGIKSFSDWNSPVWLTFDNLTVNNCNFGGAFGDSLIHGMWLELGHDLTLTNSTFQGLSFRIYYWDNYSSEFMEDNIFALGGEGNQNTYYYLGQATAFHALLVHGGTIANNVITAVRSDAYVGSGQGTGYGFRAYGYNHGYGDNNNILVYNNRITDLFYDTPAANIAAIRGPGINVYHNSVHLTGTYSYASAATSCLNGVTAAYNNAFSNDVTGGSATGTVGVTNSGTIDYNAIYSTARFVSGQATVNAAVAAGVNPHGVFAPVNFGAGLHITGVSSAKEIGKSHVLDVVDIDGDARDTTDAGKRDAGADEFSPLGSFAAADVFPGGILTPPAGVPVGPPQTPTVSVKNNSQTAASFNMSLTATDGYSDSKPVSLLPGETKTITFAVWNPAAPGPVTFTATTLLGGDAVPGNDVVTKVSTASSPIPPLAIYDFDADAQGWTPTVDWVRSSSFTKLGGVNGGSGFSWVTQRPTDPSTYTEGAYATSEGYGTTYPGPNLLTSPWLDISGLGGTDLYISFQHSIETEPLWDRSWLQYTLDGNTWHTLGTLSDPNGINWYDTTLYQNAAFDIANFDTVTCEQLYGLARPTQGTWTSNGTSEPTGPTGWVYVQLHVTSGGPYTGLVGATAVRFRYVAFSDAVTSFGGWAFDNFKLSGTPPIFGGGTISGHAWTDVNGNGVDDGEADITGTKVYISLFGNLIDSTTTNGTGDYSWAGVTLPAGYGITLNVPNVAFTVPFGVSNTATVNHPADGSTVTQDFGTFVGTISGKKYSDLNNNGINDGEPGLSGWTIEVHQDSVNHALVASTVTDSLGNYSMIVPPYGSYAVTEIAQPTIARQTGPVGGTYYGVAISGGSPTSTGNDFGNFVYGTMRVSLNVDQNGNGVKDPGDIIAVPSGFSSDFKVEKDGVGYSADSVFSLGDGIISASFTGLDLGTYTVTELDSIPGWRRTKGGVHTFIVGSSGQKDTATYLDFKYLVITGKKFNDLNGNGVLDGGEPGLAGWTINVSGGVYYGPTSAVTDTNGDYSIGGVFTGTHTVSEVSQSGWTRTLPGGAGTYSIVAISGNLINTSGKNFGNFNNTTVSGIVYRDYNGNGVKDAEDTPITGVSVDLAVNGGNYVSDGTGYSFSGVIATDTVRITVPGGYVITQPAAGEYPLALVSGGTATGLNFGLFQGSDSTTKYRTFTADQLGADDQKKPGKRPKLTKPFDPIKNKPTTANLVDDLLNPKTGQFPGAVIVGIPNQLNLGGKTKMYVVPNKQSSFWASLNTKSVHHTGMARGFDMDLKGKPILKLQKSFGPNKKQNNHLFAELLTLKLNLLASGAKTPAGLGVLIYNDPNSSLDGMTIDEIADYADTVMTNFEFVPLGVYTELDTVVAKINGAFYYPAVDDTLTGWTSAKLTWKAYTSVFEVPFLKPNPGAKPKTRQAVVVENVPTDFALAQNYPNPFNPTTTIEFDLPATSIVTLKVYNLLGQEVATLLNHEEVDFGDAVEFDASSLPSGVYLYRIVAQTVADADAGIASETFTQVKKMVLVK